MGKSLRIILSLAATSMMALAIVAAPASAHKRTTYNNHLESWVNSHEPSHSGFRTYHSSAWCSDFEHKDSSSRHWRFCKVYVPYTNTHHSDDWSSWDEEVCWSHWKVTWRKQKSWKHERLDDWHCRTLPQFPAP